MGTGVELLIGSLAMTAVSTVAGIVQAGQASAAANKAFEQNAEIAQRNLQLRAEAINDNLAQRNKAAVAQKSDMIRHAEAQLGSLRVLAGEMGTAPETVNAFIRQQGFAEATDLSRVDTAYEAQFRSAEAAKRDASLQYDSTIINAQNAAESANMRASNAMVGSMLGGIGSGLQITSDYYSDQTRDKARNQSRLVQPVK